MDREYNGWTNYNTWNVNLWIMNDYDLYKCWQAQPEWTAESAEEFTRAFFPNGTADMDSAADLDSVNWQEIADSWNESD